MRRVNLLPGEQNKLISGCAIKQGSLKILSKNLGISYSTMKKYSQEVIFLSESVFDELFKISGAEKEDFTFTYLDSNWGQSLGGKKGMQTLRKRYSGKLGEWCRKGGLERYKKQK